VFATVEYITKPSNLATEILVTGVGLALIAAVCLMAASFQRNIKTGIDADFTKVAVVVAYLGATLVVVGTILSLGKTDEAVAIVAGANLAFAVLAIIAALHAQRFLRRDVRCHKDTCCYRVGHKQDSEDDTNGPQPVAEVKQCPHVAAQEKRVDDGQRSETLTEGGEGR
jgi:hypothetical protein